MRTHGVYPVDDRIVANHVSLHAKQLMLDDGWHGVPLNDLQSLDAAACLLVKLPRDIDRVTSSDRRLRRAWAAPSDYMVSPAAVWKTVSPVTLKATSSCADQCLDVFHLELLWVTSSRMRDCTAYEDRPQLLIILDVQPPYGQWCRQPPYGNWCRQPPYGKWCRQSPTAACEARSSRLEVVFVFSLFLIAAPYHYYN